LSANVDVPVPAEPKEEKKRGLLGRLLRHPPLTAATALVALATSGVTLVYNFWPDLKPDPQVQLSGSLKVVTWESHVTYGDFLRRTNSLETLRKAQPAQRKIWGDIFYIELEGAGLKRHASELHAFFYRADTGRRSGVAPTHYMIRYGTPSDRFLTPVWTTLPTDPGKYFLRFELRARGVLLAIANSPPFGWCHEAGCGGRGGS